MNLAEHQHWEGVTVQDGLGGCPFTACTILRGLRLRLAREVYGSWWRAWRYGLPERRNAASAADLKRGLMASPPKLPLSTPFWLSDASDDAYATVSIASLVATGPDLGARTGYDTTLRQFLNEAPYDCLCDRDEGPMCSR